MTDTARAFAEKYVETEMTLDGLRVARELYAEDATLDAAGKLIVGRAALEEFYVPFLAAVERVELELGRVAGSGDNIAFEWRSFAYLKSGERVEASGCDFVTLRDGLIVHNRVYAYAGGG